MTSLWQVDFACCAGLGWSMQSVMQGRQHNPHLTRTWAENRILTALCAVSLLGLTAGGASPAGAAERIATASLSPGTEVVRDLGIPSVLPGQDAARYREIFRLQAAATWAAPHPPIPPLKTTPPPPPPPL